MVDSMWVFSLVSWRLPGGLLPEAPAPGGASFMSWQALPYDGTLRAVIAGTDGPVEFATSRLADVETMHAMTIHKSQGSQAAVVTVLMPPDDPGC